MKSPKETMSRRSFMRASTAAVGAAALCAPGKAAASDRPWERRISTKNAAQVGLLQFTDMHFFLRADRLPREEAKHRRKTLDDARRLIEVARPDLLLVTGDLWHDNPDGRGAEFMAYSVEQCAALGVPWAFMWGNHDMLDDYNVGHAAFAGAKHSLYAGRESDGNYVVTLDDGSGTALVRLFCLNTRDTGVDGAARTFVAQAAATFAGEGVGAMRLGAFHIPVRQYEEVWEQGIAAGIIGESVCYEQEDRSSLEVLRDAGIQAVCCGHDHVNDYSGMMDGVDLIYGRATGHAGYGARKVAKGAKLYTLDPARRELEWVSLLPDGAVWRPEPGERIETW